MRDFINLEDVFNDYVKEVAGKTSTYALPKTLLSQATYSEVDVSQDLEKLASIALDGPEEAKVLQDHKPQTLNEMQLINETLELAAALDKAGLVALSQELDLAVAKYMGQTVKIANPDEDERNAKFAKLDTLIAATLDGKHWMLQHYRDGLNSKLKEAQVAPEKLKEVAANFLDIMKNLSTLSDMKEPFERMKQAWPAVQTLVKESVKPLDAPLAV